MADSTTGTDPGRAAGGAEHPDGTGTVPGAGPGRPVRPRPAAAASPGRPEPRESHVYVGLGRDLGDLVDKLDSLPGPVKRALAANPNSPEELLRRIAADPAAHAEASLALNPDCPPDLLAGLAANPEQVVRVNVAANRSTPPEVLSAMVDSAAGPVAAELTRRADLPAEARHRLKRVVPGGNRPCRVCGGPGGEYLIVAARTGQADPGVYSDEEFAGLFPDVVASWCARHAGNPRVVGHLALADHICPPPGVPHPDQLPEDLELFQRELTSSSWQWRSVGGRSLEWWLAAQGRIRCGEETEYLNGGWECGQPATEVVETKYRGPVAVCDTHASDLPGWRLWHGSAKWDPAGNGWTDPSTGKPFTRPEMWHPDR